VETVARNGNYLLRGFPPSIEFCKCIIKCAAVCYIWKDCPSERYLCFSRHFSFDIFPPKISPFSISFIFGDKESRDSSVCTATGYGLDDRGVGVRVPVGSRIFTSLSRSNRLWGPPTLLFYG
jgi:hypothetical protein